MYLIVVKGELAALCKRLCVSMFSAKSTPNNMWLIWTKYHSDGTPNNIPLSHTLFQWILAYTTPSAGDMETLYFYGKGGTLEPALPNWSNTLFLCQKRWNSVPSPFFVPSSLGPVLMRLLPLSLWTVLCALPLISVVTVRGSIQWICCMASCDSPQTECAH